MLLENTSDANAKAKQRNRYTKNTKIVATLGPASNDKNTIMSLFKAGADAFRINFSHSTHDEHAKLINIIRDVENEVGRPICIIADLQGPKLRVGRFDGGYAIINTGDRFVFDCSLSSTIGNHGLVHLPHPEIFNAITIGSRILVDDGNIQMKVIDKKNNSIITKVINGGKISDHKGVNIPDVKIDIPALTEKDRNDLSFALDNGVDWVALSFVQKPEDIIEAKNIIKDRAKIIAKIEKPQAIEVIDNIIELSDGIMVARGDLGVEAPPESVPILQKMLVSKSRAAGKPVIVATQMLESMTKSPVATRAEASDVATAVFEGVDAVMLSAESASGNFPFESVSMMSRIITQVESSPLYTAEINASHIEPKPNMLGAVTNAAYKMALTLDALAIVSVTASGNTAMRIAKERPTSTNIIGLTQYITTARALALVWGVIPFHEENIEREKSIQAVAKKVINSLEFLCDKGEPYHGCDHDNCTDGGRYVIMTTGEMFGASGTTDTVKVIKL